MISRINHLQSTLFSCLLCFSGYEVQAQLSYHALFLGNSYTSVNNLPQIIHDVALSAGDTLVFDSHAPGGYQLMDHSLDSTSQARIMAGGWDYVVLQGQSQEPIAATNQFVTGAFSLYNLIRQYNACAVTMPYMTWGRKNGDAAYCPNFPEMCTYESMDSALRIKYMDLASSLQGELSPVSVVWNYLRQNHPGIELYQADESHPTTAGSYAAACCFYAALFKKDPMWITYDFGLMAGDAAIIRDAVKTQVFDSLQLWDFKRLPVADIQFQVGPGSNEILFQAIDQGVAQSCLWDFGDGDTSDATYVAHSYLADGTYTVSLTATNCDLQGWHTSFADTVIQFCSHTPTVYTNQPWVCNYDTLWTQMADSYQWYSFGQPIPETNQYVANNFQYGYSGISVLSTVNGCSELSQVFTETPQWSGYYFDGTGDPCAGDTVAFAVLHVNGFLSGFENILWFENDTLLPSMTNEDTLLIFTSGKYECKVIIPNSNCPLDTTSYLLEYHCGTSGMDEENQESAWSIFPVPASETITIKFTTYPVKESFRIHSAIGQFMNSLTTSAKETKINIADLPAGLYYILPESKRRHPLKFIKQ